MTQNRTNSDSNPLSVIYPLWLLLVRNVPAMIVFIVLCFYDFGTIGLVSGLIVAVWFLLFYLIGQYSYVKIEIYSDRINKIFLGSLYLKNQEYFYSEIEFFFFQFHVGSLVDPYVCLKLKNGKKKKIRMPKDELGLVKQKLSETGLPMLTARYAYDRP